MRIPLVNLAAMHADLQREINTAIDAVLSRGDYILGQDVFAFEEEFAAYLGARHCIGVGNGLDALTLALKGLGVGPGDEVITQANTYVATALAIHHAGGMPVLVDPGDFEKWLNAEANDVATVQSLLKPATDVALTLVAVSTRVNKPANDDASLIEPLKGEEPDAEPKPKRGRSSKKKTDDQQGLFD